MDRQIKFSFVCFWLWCDNEGKLFRDFDCMNSTRIIVSIRTILHVKLDLKFLDQRLLLCE